MGGDNDLAAIRARVAAATPGPWLDIDPKDLPPSRVDHGKRLIATTIRESARNVYGLRDNMVVEGRGVVWNSDADAELIAHAPTDILALCAEVERLRGIIAEGLDYLAAFECGDIRGQWPVIQGIMRRMDETPTGKVSP